MNIDSDIKNRPFEKYVRKCKSFSLKTCKTIDSLQTIINQFPKNSKITFYNDYLLIEYVGEESNNEKFLNDKTLQIHRNMFSRANKFCDLQTLINYCKSDL
jgi:hypothetical protein